MIKVKNLTKTFENFLALQNMNCEIPEGCIYGLVGSNGAGKSTFLRHITGIYKPDSGEITIDDKNVWDNPTAKELFIFVPDDFITLSGASIKRLAKLYSTFYKNFDYKRFHTLIDAFGLNFNKKLSTFSKGMKRQATIALALSCKTKYMFFDETFDGLDPVMRHTVKNIIFNDVCERGATVVVTSHSLRELEDFCDQLALLHKGGIVFESDIQNLKTSLFKVQIAFNKEYDKSLFEGIEIINFNKKGKISSLIIRGNKDETVKKLNALNPNIIDILPLSLEEVFIYEMEALGYAFKDIFE